MNPGIEPATHGIGFPLFPPAASTMAERVDVLFFVLLGMTGVVTLAIAGLVVYHAVRDRRRSEDEIPAQTQGSHLIEWAWTITPFILFMIPFVWGVRLYAEMAEPPADAIQIDVVAKQWMWKFEHPGGQREIDELHVPAGRPVKLIMTSQDVIHSFFVPAFRAKRDVIPGRYTMVWFNADTPGRYHLFCSEYCGTAHSHMGGWVDVMPPAEYEAWLKLGASDSPASRGAKLFQQLGCNTCHRADSLRRAPVLAGLYGRPVQLSTGEIVTADETYLRESILDPGAKIVFGWQPIMPTFRGRVSEEDILDLIAYIKSMSLEAPARAAEGGAPSQSEGVIPQEGVPIFPANPAR